MSVGAGSVLVPRDPDPESGAGVSQASDRQSRRDWINFRVRVCGAGAGEPVGGEERELCPCGHRSQPGLTPAHLPSDSRTQVRCPTADELTPSWAPPGPAGGEVSPPTPTIGSGEQRGRPAGFSDRAELVI